MPSRWSFQWERCCIKHAGRVELKSFDLDHNLHCALAERGDTMDLRPLLEVSTFESCRVFFGLLGDLLAAPHGDDLDSR